MDQNERFKSTERLAALAVAALTFATFARSLQAGFVYWDDNIVYENPHIRGLDPQRIAWMFTDIQYLWRYMPLTWLGWATTYEIFGLNPFGYHLGNVLLQCANAAMVFLLLRKLFLHWGGSELTAGRSGYSLKCAAVGALLWAVHPLRVEPVAWVTDRVYCQALFFLLISLLCYLESVRPGSDRARPFYWLSVVAFGASLLSYQTGLGYVLVLALLDLYPLKRFSEGKRRWFDAQARRVWLEKVPFAVAAAAVVILTLLARFHASGKYPKPVSLEDFGILERVMQGFYIWAYYLWRPLYPVDLSPYYTTLVSFRPTDWPFVLSLSAVAVLTLLLFFKRTRWPLLWVLWLGHLILLVPVLGLTEHPHYPSDRYSFIVGILWSALAVAGLLRLGRDPRFRNPGLAAGAALVVLLAVLSYRQAGIWQNSVALHEYMISKLKDETGKAFLYRRLGQVQLELNNKDEAFQAFKRVIELNPNDADAYWSIGMILYKQGKLDEAVAHFKRALEINPKDFSAHQNLGAALASQGKLAEAVIHFTEAVRLAPDNINARRNLARALSKTGKTDEARVQELKAEQLEAGRQTDNR